MFVSGGEDSTPAGSRRLATHGLSEPEEGGRVKCVCFIDVAAFFRGGEVERWLACQCPGGDAGVDKVAAPGGGMAGH